MAKAPPLKAAVPAKPAPPPEPPPPPEPAWIRALPVTGRRRAHELIDRLAEAGVPEPEELARREIVERKAAVAAYAVARALTGLGPDASAAVVSRLLADGEAADLEVRWRLVDGAGRPISLEEPEK